MRPTHDHLQGEENVVWLAEQDSRYLIHLPQHKSDYIQKKLFDSRIPYELDMLRDMADRLSPGDLVIDVGANIGNHSLYLVAVAGCRVVAFEPNPALAVALERSIALNGFEDHLQLRPKGVGAKTGRARFAEVRPDNLGAQRLVSDAATGDIPVVALDKARLGKPVRMIKIDVEGMEEAVLRGAHKIIARDRPALYVESATETDFRAIQRLLKAQDYLLWDTFNATPTHLFLPAETVTPEAHLNHLKAREVLESFRNTADVQVLRQQLNEANLKYRTVSGQLADVRAGQATTNARAAELKAALEEARTKYRTVSQQLAEAREARDGAMSRGDEMATELEEQTRRLNRVEAMRTGLVAALDELRWEHDQTLRRLEWSEADLKRTESVMIHDELGPLANLPTAAEMSGTGSSGTGPDVGFDPTIMAGWILALGLPPAELATKWLRLAEDLGQHYPKQRLALLRLIAALPETAADPQIARRLGISLIEEGLAAEACALLDPVEADLNLSSRQARLLKLARQEVARADHRPDRLRREAAQAVRSRLRVATIMDEFTAFGYAPECDLQQLSLAGWKAELEDFAPELLLIESAWRGLNDEWGPRVGQISGELRSILDWCKARGVPTAFWNKEDPVHFDTFLTLAQKFDLVFTTDIDCIPRYKAALGHERVQLLPFACQPELHNPVALTPRKSAFCFAGAYYVRYPDRTRDLDDFLEHLSGHLPFEIFDRNFGKDHPDYMFPEAYRKCIVGTLPPSKIDRAYKGYDFGINLNSVKHSQSMFARRVFELLASNTRVVSNYAPGMRRLFGDLVIATDSGDEALRRIRQQDAQGIVPRLRLAGLRKVMAEHTYSHRVGQIVRAVGLEIPDPAALPRVIAVGQAADRNMAARLLAGWRRQSLSGIDFVLVVPKEVDLSGLAQPDRLRLVSPNEAAAMTLGALVGPDAWLAGFVPEDYHGPDYLLDLILSIRYARARVLGKAAYYRLVDGAPVPVEGPAYGPAETLALRRAVQRADRLDPAQTLADWLTALPEAEACCEDASWADASDGAGNLLALDPFSYCEGGGGAVVELGPMLDTPAGLETGLSGAALQAIADALLPSPSDRLDPAQTITGASLVARMVPPASGQVNWETTSNEAVRLTSTLGTDAHVYIYENDGCPLAQLAPESLAPFTVHAPVGPGLSVLFVAVWQDADRQKIDHQIFGANTNTRLTPPEGTAFVRFGMRPRGPGACVLQGIKLAEHFPPPRPVIGPQRDGVRALVLTNHYPSYQDLYRNGFVHSRLRGYRELGGLTLDVYRLRADQPLTFHEFQNIEVMTGSAEQLDFLLTSGRYDHVLVHFLDPKMWDVLSRHIDRVRVTVWVHGAEVQPWWRRSFNYATEAELEAAKPASDARLAFWRGLFAPLHPNLHFVFVSQYFAEEVFEDLEVICPPAQYQVIHNPIDDQLFAYHEKPVEQRAKILSIRSFASPKYANDLTVQAILALQRRDVFDQLEFRIIGDGPLFDKITAPLAGLSNVICEKRFLQQSEIAALQRDYGVFLNPTRWDSQGVSRDEAMSAGLVPVTSRNSAIPEFVDERCGYLAETEDAEGLARAILELWKHPEIFAAKSRAAAERVRAQRGRAAMIGREMVLLQGQDGGGGS